MKILFITSSSINGGAQKHIREMFKSFTELAHEVYLIAPEGWLIEELKSYGEKVIPLSIGVRKISELSKIIDKIKPDITNTFILSGGVYGTLAWKKEKYGKLFVTVNNPVLYPGVSTKGRLLYPRMYRFMSKYTSAFLVKSDQVREEVDNVIRHKKPVISIKNGVDFHIFDKNKEYPDFRDKLGIGKADIVITNVAALDIRKGQRYLIEAAIEVREEYPIQVFIIGEGNLEKELKALVKKRDAEEYIHFLGHRSDINYILAKTDIFILPSIHEGLPNSLMEAMAMGLPCIATDVGGVRQLIDSGDKGIVIKPEFSTEIVDGIRNLLSDKNKMETIGANACRKILKEYSQDVVVKELEEIYKRY